MNTFAKAQKNTRISAFSGISAVFFINLLILTVLFSLCPNAVSFAAGNFETAGDFEAKGDFEAAGTYKTAGAVPSDDASVRPALAAAAADTAITSVEDFSAALAGANDGDTILVGDIVFNPMPGGMILITKNITIKSIKPDNAVFSNATFAVNGTVNGALPLTVKFENIDFRGDVRGTAVDTENPPLVSSELPLMMKTMCAAIFKMNVDATFTGCTFEGYHYGYGGAINAIYSSEDNKNELKLTLSDCVFRCNAARYGGCVYISGLDGNVTLNAENCIFEGNAASAGGAVFAEYAHVNISECVFSENGYISQNTTSSDGGAMSLVLCQSVIDGCRIENNVSGGDGAGIFCEISPFKTLVMQNCTIKGNAGVADEGISVRPQETDYDTPALIRIYFSTIYGKHNISDCSEVFGCVFSDEKDGKNDPSDTKNTIPDEALKEIAGGKFADSLGILSDGDNYRKEVCLVVETIPGKADTICLKYGERLCLSDPSRKGYSFAGWEYSDGTPYENNKIFLGGSLKDEKITARWRFLISEHLYLIWVPAVFFSVAGLAICIALLKKLKKKNRQPVAQTLSDETAGNAPLPDDWVKRVCEKPEICERLSKREAEVLQKLLEGKSRKQAADELFVTEATIRKHSTSIYSKLGVHNRTELIYKLTRQ